MENILHAPLPWYIAGPLIGLAAPVLLILGNKPFGISSTLKDLCAICIPTLKGDLRADLKANAWNLWFAAGILVGGILHGWLLYNSEPVAISSATVRDLNEMGITDTTGLVPGQIFNWSNLLTLQGWLFMVLGGLLVGFGTRYGGGCTSGHGILGLATFSKGSLLAVIGFFIGGLTMTYLIFPLIF